MKKKNFYLKQFVIILFIAICFFIESKGVLAAGTLTTSGLIFNSDSSANISRANATKVQVPENLLNPTQGWVAIRVKMGFASNATLSPDPILWDASQSDPADLFVYYDVSTDQFHLARASKIGGKILSSPTQSFSTGAVKTIIAAWTSTTLKISIDGAAFTSTTESVIPGQGSFLIGSTLIQGSGRQPNSDYYWVAGGNGTLTDANAATINSFGNIDKRRVDFPESAVFIWWANNTQYNNDTTSVTSTLTPTPRPSVTSTVTLRPSVTNTPTSSSTKPGDANGDGKVDGIDFVIWVQNYGRTTSRGYLDGDFNSDTFINGIDYVIWLSNYGL